MGQIFEMNLMRLNKGISKNQIAYATTCLYKKYTYNSNRLKIQLKVWQTDEAEKCSI